MSLNCENELLAQFGAKAFCLQVGVSLLISETSHSDIEGVNVL